MLVLSREVEEEIRIGASVAVKVLEIRRRRVKLGVTAPEGTLVLRSELMAPGWKIPPRFPNDPVLEASMRDVVFDLFNGIPRSQRHGYVGHLNRILEELGCEKGDSNERK
jgi:carbon storage regulator CsrA